MSRAKIKPIVKPIPAARQNDARHYGVHPYFTRRPSNVVRTYLDRFSVEGDTVLDPFGGTGVTAIEAMLLGRLAIHNDLNPFANFITRCIADTRLDSIAALTDAFERVRAECEEPLREIETSESAAQRRLGTLPLPENIPLPRSSDAEHFYEMFTSRQLAGLALLKRHIDEEPTEPIRELLLLAWSASLAKLNRTFISAKGRAESRGGSSIFSIYRYKLASANVELPIWKTFEGRFRNVVAAKREVLTILRYRQQVSGLRPVDSRSDLKVFCLDAAALGEVVEPESVDYIFTDPPYGAFISYLDLSVLWNHWLGFPVSADDARNEAIVGGELEHSEAHYKKRLSASIEAALRLLRPDRWMSIVFQHWDVSYFETILQTVEENGAQLKAAITQTGDVIWSMHKKKNSASVLAGELILTFYKPLGARRRQSGANEQHMATSAALSDVIDRCIDGNTENFTSEALFNRLVIELWRQGALGCLGLDRRTFAEHLELRGWHYNPKSHVWSRAKSEPQISNKESLF